MFHRLHVLYVFVGLCLLALRDPRAVRAELHGPEDDAR
jgi:hypothetical protein